VAIFILCGSFAVILVVFAGAYWWSAVLISAVLFLVALATIGRRFKAALANDDIAFWLIAQRMLPPVAVILPIFMMFQELGMLDTLWALIVVYTATSLPLVIWFMRDYFLSIPMELEESAFIDGASRLQVVLKIVLPLSVPGLVATFLIVLVFAWNELIFAIFLTRGDSQTMPVLVVAQNATRGPQWWNISLLVLLMVAPIVIVALVLERFIARGILLGAVKG
jgi:multiple sugar transport system permease protein